MKQIIKRSVFLGVLFFCTAIQGQTLRELINTALAQNYQIQVLKNEQQIAANNNTAGNAGQLPSVAFNGTLSTALNNTRQSFSDGTIREGSNASNTNINLSLLANWTAFNGFKVYAKKEQLGYLEQLGQVNAKFYIEQTVADIASAYYQLLYENELLKNYRQSLSISAYRLSIEKKRKEVGAGKGVDYQLALVDYQSDSIRVLAQQNAIKSLQIQLNKLLINDPENEITVKDATIKVFPLPNKDSLFEATQQNNSQLEQAKLEELVAETELRIKKADSYPKIDLFAGMQYSNTFSEVGFINRNRNLGPIAGVSISFNLFNGGNVNREIKNTTLSLENSELNKKKITQDINADLLNLYYQYQSVLERIALAESNLQATKKVYSITQEQFNKGAINGYDFRLTQQNLLNVELTVVQLKFSLKSLEISMKRLSGSTLEAYL